MGLLKRKPKVEAPLFDDGPTCPYTVKPSEIFAMNEVGAGEALAWRREEGWGFGLH